MGRGSENKRKKKEEIEYKEKTKATNGIYSPSLYPRYSQSGSSFFIRISKLGKCDRGDCDEI